MGGCRNSGLHASNEPLRIVVMGASTCGENFVKSAVPLPDGSETVVSTGIWERPDVDRPSQDRAARGIRAISGRTAGFVPWQVVPEVELWRAPQPVVLPPNGTLSRSVVASEASQGNEKTDLIKLAVESLKPWLDGHSSDK